MRRRIWKPDLLAGMLVGILFVVLVGAAIIVIPRLTTPQTPSGNAIVSSPTPQTPSGNAIDPSAASFITTITTTSSVDPLTAAPGPVTQTFKMNATVYVVFQLNLKNFDFKTHDTVYIQAKFYGDKTFVYQGMLIFKEQRAGGFFEAQYTQPMAGSVELYWCLQSSCSDGKLAQTTSFTIIA
jgi:hypothetical protein